MSLIEEYRHHAADHGRFIEEGDSVATNNAYDRLQEVFLAIIDADKGSELFSLYDDPNPWVQAWAAAHTLEVDETKALLKLDQIEKASFSIISMNAEYTIQGWKSGELRYLPL